MQKFSRVALLLGLSVGSLALADACGHAIGSELSDAGEVLRDAGLSDAGSWLIDAGTALQDSGQDAGAQTSGGIDSRAGSRLSVARVVYSGADGSQLDTGTTELFDTSLGMVCARSAYPMSDGTYRCLPTPAAFGTSPATTFADAACTMELVTAGSCALPGNAVAIVQQSPGTCSAGSGNVIHAYALGAEHTGSIYVKAGANCVLATASVAARYYLRGTEVAPSTYVSLTRVP